MVGATQPRIPLSLVFKTYVKKEFDAGAQVDGYH